MEEERCTVHKQDSVHRENTDKPGFTGITDKTGFTGRTHKTKLKGRTDKTKLTGRTDKTGFTGRTDKTKFTGEQTRHGSPGERRCVQNSVHSATSYILYTAFRNKCPRLFCYHSNSVPLSSVCISVSLFSSTSSISSCTSDRLFFAMSAGHFYLLFVAPAM